MGTNYTTLKRYLVILKGQVVIEANSGPEAQAAATAYWIATGQNLDFTVQEQTSIQPVTTP